MLLLILLSALFFLLTAKIQRTHIVLLTGILTLLTSYLMKIAVGRPRPDLWPHEILNSYSFPSGHAFFSFSVYGLLAYLFAESYPKYKKLAYVIFALITGLVGLSRVQLGVHWPSDVLGGWLMGAALLYLMVWWYKNGGIGRTIRIGIGLVVVVIGLIGLIIPIIPGIPLIIGGVFLIVSNKSIGDFFKKKKLAN